jgi:multidrug efflux system outer membrane protein
MSAKRAGMPTDWTVAQMTGDPAAIIADYGVFGDAQLVAYVQEALENNRSLRAAIESVRQSEYWRCSRRARACSRRSAASLAPAPALRPMILATTPTNIRSPQAPAMTSTSWATSTPRSRRRPPASARREAVYEQTRRQIAGQVARAYFAVIEGQLQLDLDRKSIDRQRQTFRITQTRFDAGSIARDELVLGESNLAQAEDSIIASEASLRAAVRALELALGRFPQNKLAITGHLPEPPATPPLGLPELTVRSRPDVVAAELNMIQTFANTRIASMAPWPQLNATSRSACRTRRSTPRATCSTSTVSPSRSALRWRRSSSMAARRRPRQDRQLAGARGA